jgi:drug/metabolite transporter (DMT)-like permease
MFFLNMFPFLALGLATRGRAVISSPAGGWAKGLAGGACSLCAYGIVLWAMTRAPIAPVSALRETSVLFGTALGALLLKERFGPSRWLSAGLIAAGAAAIKML